ncbi:unnamed protein product (mitochondrion) [Plasmodiophora brassicae]|uniref:Uncharacterized protein n=1 Tax=Plasmodiophora brassicae TaxID=37360 RepID=A0A3P3Y3X4_PLABS|nr:unnamed protein product [Plasmodiophora brassicae]
MVVKPGRHQMSDLVDRIRRLHDVVEERCFVARFAEQEGFDDVFVSEWARRSGCCTPTSAAQRHAARPEHQVDMQLAQSLPASARTSFRHKSSYDSGCTHLRDVRLARNR